MCAFVVFGLVFPYQAKRLASGNVFEMIHFVSSGTYNLAASVPYSLRHCLVMRPGRHVNANPGWSDLRWSARKYDVQITSQSRAGLAERARKCNAHAQTTRHLLRRSNSTFRRVARRNDLDLRTAHAPRQRYANEVERTVSGTKVRRYNWHSAGSLCEWHYFLSLLTVEKCSSNPVWPAQWYFKEACGKVWQCIT